MQAVLRLICFYCSLYAPIRRGQTVWPYAVSADDRILEMDYDELIFEKKSRYQTIRIFHSREFGNVLFLDGDASEFVAEARCNEINFSLSI